MVPVDSDLKVGRVFETKQELKDVVHMMALKYNFHIRSKKSNKLLYTVVCADENCTWRLRATKFAQCDYFQIRKYTPEHTCSLNTSGNHHKQARSWVIGKHIMSSFDDPKAIIRPADIINNIRKEFGIEMSYQQGRRCREAALTYIRGSPEDNYSKLAAYAHNLKGTNPGTIYSLEVDNENRFKYFFLAYGACIRGFHSSMRPVVILDGTFLTGKYCGTLIIATCQDANKHVYPLAWGVVDSENDASWRWFFTNLKEVIGDNEDLVVISDRHRSIISDVQAVFQNARHAHCTYHIKGNLKVKTRNTETHSLFIKAANAYTVEEFQNYMHQIGINDKAGWEYLNGTNFQTWARSYFQGNRYNIMTSNNVESLNSVFKKDRETPMITLFEGIGKTLQEWFCKRRETSRCCLSRLAPKKEEKLRKSCEVSKKFKAEPLDRLLYVVSSSTMNFIVNFAENTCTCRKFQLDYLPCEHAISAAKKSQFSVYELCSPYYTTECWRKAYEETIFPAPNENEWNIPEDIKEMNVLPPEVRRRVGRRRKTRIPSTGEFPKKKKCSRCKQGGHNRLTCRDQTPMIDRES